MRLSCWLQCLSQGFVYNFVVCAQALEKLSHEHPQAVLRQGGLVAVLSYLDFFQTGVQRVAVATAATMCRSLTPDSIDAVSTAVPILTNLLQYQVCNLLAQSGSVTMEASCGLG
jgi:E3 ubiquitin-protein ligase TRIP12